MVTTSTSKGGAVKTATWDGDYVAWEYEFNPFALDPHLSLVASEGRHLSQKVAPRKKRRLFDPARSFGALPQWLGQTAGGASSVVN